MAEPHFGSETFQFLAELRLNNDRQWFAANKPRYERCVKGPLLEFIAEFGEVLPIISSHFVADARPNGGSMFRIYRDVRFSKDKSPYKTHAAAHFRHARARNVHAPGFYLHLEPGNVGAGCGIWRPDTPSLARIRDAIVANPVGWKGATEGIEGLSLMPGEPLKRAPKGYDPEHPLIEVLKSRSFALWAGFSEEEATASDFLERFHETCARAGPMTEFLCRALDLEF